MIPSGPVFCTNANNMKPFEPLGSFRIDDGAANCGPAGKYWEPGSTERRNIYSGYNR